MLTAKTSSIVEVCRSAVRSASQQNGAATNASFKGRTPPNVLSPPGPNQWKLFQVVGEVPTGAVYAVPAISFDTRPAGTVSTLTPPQSPAIYVAGAAVYNFGSAERISTEGPNPYLRMGDYTKRIGLPTATPPVLVPPVPTPFPGYPIGKKA